MTLVRLIPGAPQSRVKHSTTEPLPSLNADQRYCRMLQWEHSAILSTFIKLLFVLTTFVLSLFLSGRLRQVLLYMLITEIMNVKWVKMERRIVHKISMIKEILSALGVILPTESMHLSVSKYWPLSSIAPLYIGFTVHLLFFS